MKEVKDQLGFKNNKVKVIKVQELKEKMNWFKK